jgi:hypothetical protein
MRPNKANQAELESKIFIEIGWASEGYKAATAPRYPFQSAYRQGVRRLNS